MTREELAALPHGAKLRVTGHLTYRMADGHPREWAPVLATPAADGSVHATGPGDVVEKWLAEHAVANDPANLERLEVVSETIPGGSAPGSDPAPREP